MQASREVPRRYVRIEEAAAYTSLSVRHLHDLTRLGEIPHIRVGRVVLYDLVAIDEWLAGMKAGAGEAGADRPLGLRQGRRGRPR